MKREIFLGGNIICFNLYYLSRKCRRCLNIRRIWSGRWCFDCSLPSCGGSISTALGAIESITIDVKNDKSPEIIVTNAVISAGFSAFTSAGCEGVVSNKKTYDAINEIKITRPKTLKGNHPNVKSAANEKIKLLKQALRKGVFSEVSDIVIYDAIQYGVNKFFEFALE